MTDSMRVLVACECSGIVRDAFRKLGHDAWSCDLLPCEGDSEWHLEGDALYAISDNNGFYFRKLNGHVHWDMLIAHPPCDFLSGSGNRWLYEECSRGTPEQRIADRELAIKFFLKLLNSKIPKVAVENPRPHPYVIKKVGQCSQLIQPWEFGDKATKGTCLWLKGLPPLMATIIENGADRKPLCHREGPGPNRKANRSRTYPGIAAAMAKQWGSY